MTWRAICSWPYLADAGHIPIVLERGEAVADILSLATSQETPSRRLVAGPGRCRPGLADVAPPQHRPPGNSRHWDGKCVSMRWRGHVVSLWSGEVLGGKVAAWQDSDGDWIETGRAQHTVPTTSSSTS